jgi:hypothetical protein
MSVNTKSSVFDLINPCQISETNRTQSFIQSDASSYNGGSGEIRFTFNANEVMDLTESFIDCLITLNETDPEVPTQYTLDLTGATAGSYRLGYAGQYTTILPYNAVAADVELALSRVPLIGGQGFSVSVTGTLPVLTIQFSEFNNFGKVFDDGEILEFIPATPLTGLAPAQGLPIILTQAGELSYPRLEYLAPIIRSVRIKCGSQQITSIPDANYLSNMARVMKSTGNRYSQYYGNDQYVNGYTSSSQFRIRIELDHIDFFRKILPLKFFNQQIIVSMQLEQPELVLVNKTSTNNGSYKIDTPKFHYHSLTLTDLEESRIKKTFNEGGVVIPFQNWSSFSQNIGAGANTYTGKFDPSVSNLLAVFFVMTPDNYANDSSNTCKLSTFLRNRIGSYRLKIGSTYFPTDQVDSLQPGNRDMVEPIAELEHAITKIRSLGEEHDGDRILYFNYTGGVDGNDPEEFFYNIQYQERRQPTWIGGISCADTPHNQWGHICRSDALSGQNTSNLSNVNLELKNLSLTQDNTIHIFSLHQDFLIFSPKGVRWQN